MKFIVEYAGGHSLDLTVEHNIHDENTAREFFEVSWKEVDLFEESNPIPMRLISIDESGDEADVRVLRDNTKLDKHVA